MRILCHIMYVIVHLHQTDLCYFSTSQLLIYDVK